MTAAVSAEWPRIEEKDQALTLANRRFRLKLSTAPCSERRLLEFRLASKGDGVHDIDTGFRLWTGFAALTGHLHDYFITTESPQSPTVKRLPAEDGCLAVRYGPMQVATLRVEWEFRLDAENLWITSRLHNQAQLKTDNEVCLLLFDCPADGDLASAYLDSGFVLPPREWFRLPPQKITYEGSWKSSNRDALRRWRFSGQDHRWLQIQFSRGFGLQLESDDNASFKVCMTPLAENGDGLTTYRYLHTEHFGIGTPFENERRTYVPEERHGATVKISWADPQLPPVLDLQTPDADLTETTHRFQRTHGHSTQPHDSGFCNGCHAVGKGFPGVESGGSEYVDSTKKDGVTFEYFMHGHTHLYSVWPGMDDHLKRTLEAIDAITWPDGMIYGGHRLGKRGLFYETNASCLCFFADVVRRTGDAAFLPQARRWRDYIAEHVDPADGLFRTPSSTGVAGRGNGSRISHWWDVIAFGGYDGYINALTYRAFDELAAIERAFGDPRRADEDAAFAKGLREGFNAHLWNPATGRYAGWKDADGNLHDAWYTYINLMAILYGITPDEKRLPLLQSLDDAIRNAGYRGFSLPANLEPIPPDDYSGGDWWYEEYGYRHNYDPLGIYLNGGVWPWISGYHIAAWAEYDPDRALALYRKVLGQYHKDNLYGIGNGYFWDTATGLDAIGSREEAYLANPSVCIWGFLRLFGIDFDLPGGISLRPRLPAALSGSGLGVDYHGRRIRFRFEGHGNTVRSVSVDGRALPEARIPDAELRDGCTVTVTR